MAVVRPLRVTALLVGLLAGQAVAKGIPSFAGPFIAYGDRFYLCSRNGTMSEWQAVFRTTHFNPQRPFDKQLLSGQINVTSAFDDRWWGFVEISVRSNNQWKENAFLFRFPRLACTALRSNMPDFFRVLYSKLGDVAKGKGACRVPVDTYDFDRQPVEWVFPNVPIIPYGHYRFSIVSGVPGGTDPKVCLSVECHAIPKPGRKPAVPGGGQQK